MTNESIKNHEFEERVVQETEIHDLLADVEGVIRRAPTDFVRLTIKPVRASKHRANVKLAQAIEETNSCLTCGEPLEQGGFCGYKCLKNYDGETDDE
jgi:hypothetical protein